MGFGEAIFGETGFGDVGFGETGFGEVGFSETGFGEAGFGEAGFGETGGYPNFRGIVLSSVFDKLFDNIVLERYGEKPKSCELQFGFQAKSLTNVCTIVLKEAIAYFTNHRRSNICTFLVA